MVSPFVPCLGWGLNTELQFAPAPLLLQLSEFLANAHPRWYPYFLFLARTGLRLGESLAVEVSDVCFDERVIVVNKAYSRGILQTPKDGESRDVDLSLQLAEVLKAMIAERRARCFAMGESDACASISDRKWRSYEPCAHITGD